jgi:adenylate cyclase class 2
MTEVEVKIRVEDADGAARKLESLGATLVRERAFEDNRLFDLPDGALARGGRLLRLRVCAGRAVLTGKGPAPPAAPGRYKVRTEAETGVADPEALVQALAAAGLAVRWRYQKWRREYRLAGASVVVDEIPHGTWIEIEGEPAAIETVAARMGFDASSFETTTYREIHERRCAERGVPPLDMVFAGPGSSSA